MCRKTIASAISVCALQIAIGGVASCQDDPRELEKTQDELIHEFLEKSRREHAAAGGNPDDIRIADPEMLKSYHRRVMIQQSFPDIWVVGDFVIPRSGAGGLAGIGNDLREFEGNLQLTGDQLKQLRVLKTEFEAEMQRFVTKRNRVLNSQSKPDLEEFGRIYSEFEKKIYDQVLLPFQIELLTSKIVDHVGVPRLLITPFFQATFATTEKQDEKIRSESKKLANELRADATRLKEKAKHRLLSTLSDVQRRKIKESGVDLDAYFDQMTIDEIISEIRMVGENNYLGYQKLDDFWERNMSKR